MKKLVIIFAAIVFMTTGCQENKKQKTSGPAYSKFQLIKPTDITPQGWLRTFLENQKEGLTGNIEAAGYPFNGPMWTGSYAVNEEDRFWWPYEQSGYFVDGCLRAGYLLNDTLLINKAKRQVDYVLKNQQPNGRLGPASLKGRWNLWPYAGFLRSFMTEYRVHNDTAIVKAMQRHYANYTGKDFADELDVNNAEELCWLFEITGDSTLLKKAEEAYNTFRSDHKFHDRDGRDIVFASDMVPNYHGVCYTEIVKIPAILYSYTGKKEYLDEAEHGIAKMEEHHMLASGVPSSSEHFAGKGERNGHETCNLATLPYTYGYMLRITGDAKWGDKIEKAVFNAGIGSITKDFTAHQYFSSPNQFIATQQSCHLGYHAARFMFAPGHDTECCTGNLNRFMPYYIEQQWLTSKDNGVVASLFGAGEVNVAVGNDATPVHITQTTKYPFDETIEFTIQTEKPVAFPFYIRIPQWTNEPTITAAGKAVTEKITTGEFFRIDREFNNGDKIVVHFPMNVSINAWPNDGEYISRGPIVYSLPITSEKKIVPDYKKSTEKFPAFELTPVSEWNYGLTTKDPKDIKVVINNNDDFPWSTENAPVTLQVPAKKLPQWTLLKVTDKKISYSALQTPAFPADRATAADTETITLVPYGNTLLRLTVFPAVKEN